MKNYTHQQKIIDANPKRRGLFLGTGAGKSRIACLLAEGLTLVVCPKTVRDKKHWEEEWSEKLQKNIAHLNVMSKEDFKKIWKEDPEIFSSFDTIIGDEAHTLAGVQPSTRQKNYVKYPRTSQLHQNFVDMVAKVKPERVYLLTATPTSQPMVVWGLATILGYKWDFFHFRDTFYFEKSRNIFFKKKGKSRQLADAVNHIGEVGRLQDWFDVPEQTYKEHHVEPTPAQQTHLPKLQLLYPDPLVQLGKRHQLEQGIYEKEFVTENKTKAIRQYLEEFNKVVIYARYTAQIERLTKNLREATQHEVLVMTGGTSNRGVLLELAEKSEKCVFIVQAQISEGYELPSFPCMIFASEFSFVHRRQAEGRILRSNALKKNLYVTLLCGQADARMRQAVETGEEFDEEVHAVNISKQRKI